MSTKRSQKEGESLTVIDLCKIQVQRHEQKMQKELDRFIKTVVLPQLNLEEKKRLLHAFEEQDIPVLLEMINPYIMRHKIRMDNTDQKTVQRGIMSEV